PWARAPARAAFPADQSAQPAATACAARTRQTISAGRTAISSTDAWPRSLFEAKSTRRTWPHFLHAWRAGRHEPATDSPPAPSRLSVGVGLAPDQDDQPDRTGHQRNPEQDAAREAVELVVADDQQRDRAERPEDAGPAAVGERRERELLFPVEPVPHPGD